MDDPFIKDHDEIAGEFLTNWLPFLTRDLSDRCSQTLAGRIRSLRRDQLLAESSECTEQIEQTDPDPDPDPNECSVGSSEESASWSDHMKRSGWGTDLEADEEPNLELSKVRMSWADMAQEEDKLAVEDEKAREKSPLSMTPSSPRIMDSENEEVKEGGKKKVELSREQREWIRFKNVGRKKDFICLNRVKGKIVNILDGLELHTRVFSAVEQKRIVDFVYELQEKGRRLELGGKV